MSAIAILRQLRLTRGAGLEGTAEHIAELAHQASRATSARLQLQIGDGAGVVRRAAKQGGDAAEEFLNDTTQRSQRRSVDWLDDKTKVDQAN